MSVGTDLTKGSVARTLVRFTLPFLLSNVLHTLYSIVDMYIVGQYADATQISAVSIGAVVMMMVNGLIMGLGTGSTVLVGQTIGSRQEKEEKETISTVFTVFPLFAVIMLVLCQFLVPVLLRFLNTPPEAWDGAEAYLRICFIGLIFTGFFFAIASVLRAMGDSKGPMIFIAISCICNILGDILCVGVLHMGAAGAALATSVSQGLSVVIGYFYLRRRNFPFDFRLKSFRIYGSRLRMLLRIGVPTALQETMTSVSFLVLESIINKMGYIATAAVGICDRVFSVAAIPASAFTAAISAMVAQNTGAGEYRRSRECLRVGLLIALIVAILMFGALALFPSAIIGSFTKDASVVSAGVDYMTFFKFDCLLVTLAFCVNGYINGTGHTRYTMIVNLIAAFVVRLPLVWYISQLPDATLYHISFGMPSASLVQFLVGIAFLLFAKSERENRKRPDSQLHQPE